MSELNKELEERPYIDAFDYIEYLGEKIEDRKLIKINRFLQEDRKKKNKEIERLNNIIDKNKYSADELNEIERLNKTLEDIDTYIHLWKLEEIGEKTMLILNDILLIKNGMVNEVVRLNGSDKE